MLNLNRKNKSCLLEKIYRFLQTVYFNLNLLKKSFFYKNIKKDITQSLKLLEKLLHIIQEFKKDIELKQ